MKKDINLSVDILKIIFVSFNPARPTAVPQAQSSFRWAGVGTGRIPVKEWVFKVGHRLIPEICDCYFSFRDIHFNS